MRSEPPIPTRAPDSHLRKMQYRLNYIKTNILLNVMGWGRGVLFHRIFSFQQDVPKDCHLSSGCLLEVSNGLSVAFSYGNSLLWFMVCNILPWTTKNNSEIGAQYSEALDIHGPFSDSTPSLAPKMGRKAWDGFHLKRLFSGKCSALRAVLKVLVVWASQPSLGILLLQREIV